MAKLDVEVGDEFPADEIRKDEDGVVHHHHYYYRRRGPFRFLRFVLIIMLVSMLFRALRFITDPPYWNGRWADHWTGPAYYGWNPVAQMIGLGVGIAVIIGALWFLRSRDPEGPR